MSESAADLLRFIDNSPSPYHAVAETVARLEGAGFERLEEGDLWQLAPGDARYVVRGDASILAFQVGNAEPAEAGFRIVGAHTDSPNLRVKPRSDVTQHGLRQLAVEPYGGVLLHTWLDRDLGLAGRVVAEVDGQLRTALVHANRPMLRVPNLAIHLYRELQTDGLKLNAQKHMLPVMGFESGPTLEEWLVAELAAQGMKGVEVSDLRGFDLMTADTLPSALGGHDEEFIFAPRLDNLASCHAAISALIGAGDAPLPSSTRVVVLYDHEEVGSESAQGAGGPLLLNSLSRIGSAIGKEIDQALPRATARSLLVSADMAHAVHPNYSDRHEPGHQPKLGAGPVVKVNSGQSYASDAQTVGRFTHLCQQVGVEPQHFVTRSDMGCGSTIGPISSARTGIPTVDVGNPMLSMHSCREMAARDDVAPMIDVLTAFFRDAS